MIYGSRRGTFTIIQGLDLSGGDYFRADYNGRLILIVTDKDRPTECLGEKIVWKKEVMQSVAQILSQSDVMVILLSQIRPYVIITRTELLGSGLDLGLTGRDPRYPNDRDRLALQFAWSNIQNHFPLASIMSHEYRHSSQALDRQFVTSEAAPFIMLQQYLV
jgi:hypothetical protein